MSRSRDPDISGDTKTRVMQAAIKLITSEKESFQSITVRKIAKAAGVNVAAVNYHFGSKKNVLNEVLQFFLKRLIKGLSPRAKETRAETRLKEFIGDYVSFTFSNHKFVREMIVHVILDNDDSNEGLKGLLHENGYQPLLALLKEIKPTSEPLDLSFLIIQMISSILFPVLEAGIIRQVVGVDFQDLAIVEKYGQFLMKKSLS